MAGLVLVGGRGFVVALALLGVLAVSRVFTIVRAVRAWGYAERDNDLLVRHGLLVRRLSIVPYARMQFVDVSAGPLERAFDLATVQLHTAAAASDARIPGLRPGGGVPAARPAHRARRRPRGGSVSARPASVVAEPRDAGCTR